MFTEIKAIEATYEERMGHAPGANGRPSLTALIIKALFAIAREVEEVKKEVYTRGKSG